MGWWLEAKGWDVGGCVGRAVFKISDFCASIRSVGGGIDFAFSHGTSLRGYGAISPRVRVIRRVSYYSLREIKGGGQLRKRCIQEMVNCAGDDVVESSFCVLQFASKRREQLMKSVDRKSCPALDEASLSCFEFV